MTIFTCQSLHYEQSGISFAGIFRHERQKCRKFPDSNLCRNWVRNAGLLVVYSINSRPKHSVLKPLSRTGKIAIQLFQKEKKSKSLSAKCLFYLKKKIDNSPKLLLYFQNKVCSAVFIKKKTIPNTKLYIIFIQEYIKH